MTVSRQSSYIAGGISLAFLLLVVSCGGGGGGGGSGDAPPVVYAGNTSAAVVSPLNASTLVSNVVGSDSTAGTVLGAVLVHQDALAGQSSGRTEVTRRLSQGLRESVRPANRTGAAPALQIDDTDPCDGGMGTVRTSGTLSDVDFTGTLTVVYNNCLSGPDTLNGRATLRIDAFDFAFGIFADSTTSFSRLTIRGPGLSVDMSGSLRTLANASANTETITENIVSLDNLTGRTTKSENLAYVYVYSNFFAPTSYSASFSGRLFDHDLGFVDIVTSSPLAFGTIDQFFPDSGQFRLTGAGNSAIRVTTLSATLVRLDLDIDGDSVFERSATMKWTDLSGPVGADLGDSDGDGMHNSWETANGLNPSDPSDAALDNDADGLTNLEEYQAGTDPNVANPPPPPPPPPPPGAFPAQIIPLADNSAIVYNAVSQRIYAAVRGTPGSIVPIHPSTGSLGTPIPVGNNPGKLALSDDGQYLYVGLAGESAVQRVNLTLPIPAVDLTIPLGSGSLGALFAEDIAVLPGSPQSIAVSLRNIGFSPRHEGVAIFDNAVKRATVTPGHAGSNVIEFSASAGTLYGYNNETTEFGFRRMSVTAAGVTVLDVYDSFAPGGALISGFGVDIKFHGGLIYTTTGRVIDPVSRTLVGTLSPLPTFSVLVEPDALASRIFTLAFAAAQGKWILRAFDATTLTSVGVEEVSGISGDPANLLRWGTKGLAFRTSGGQVFLSETSTLVP